MEIPGHRAGQGAAGTFSASSGKDPINHPEVWSHSELIEEALS